MQQSIKGFLAIVQVVVYLMEGSARPCVQQDMQTRSHLLSAQDAALEQLRRASYRLGTDIAKFIERHRHSEIY